MSVALNLFDNVQSSDALIMSLGDGVSGKLRKWQRSIRGDPREVGGFWIGTADFHGSRSDMLEMYLGGMARRLVETAAGGIVTWEGLIADMDLTLDGQTYTRSLPLCANAMRCIYSSVGDNEFANGSAESALWDAVGTPSTRERVTTWATSGTYGVHIVTDDAGEGVLIEAGLTITANIVYQCYVTVDVVSGVWTLAVHNTANDQPIASAVTTDVGNDVLMVRIGEDNIVTGVYVRLTADAAAAEIYADAAVLQTAPTRAETEWRTDVDSIAEYGRIENVLLEAAMTDAAAEGKVLTELAQRAWPRTRPPVAFSVAAGQEDGLSILFTGYYETLKWLYALTAWTAEAGVQVAALVAESEFVTAGSIESNTMSYQIEQDEPVTIYDVLTDILHAGSTSGARYIGGVYAGRQFNYEAASTTLDYHYRGGRLLDVHGGPVEPWLARPGLARLDDAPVGPGELTGNIGDDPRNIWISEVEFIAPDTLKFKREMLPGERR